jgi:hypothetical protein
MPILPFQYSFSLFEGRGVIGISGCILGKQITFQI